MDIRRLISHINDNPDICLCEVVPSTLITVHKIHVTIIANALPMSGYSWIVIFRKLGIKHQMCFT